MSAHTPGPWRVDDSHDIVGPGLRLVVNGRWSPDPESNEANRANACLIAAAPDLLEVCRALYELVDPCHAEEPAAFLQVTARARAAIAKAEGRP